MTVTFNTVRIMWWWWWWWCADVVMFTKSFVTAAA